MNEQPPRKPRKTMGWNGLFIVVGTCVVLLAILAVGKALLRPMGPGIQPQTRCANHLRQFGGILTSESMERGPPSSGGAPLFISYRRKRFIQVGREQVFTCPDDPGVHVPTTDADSAIYDTVDVTDPDALAPLCSYAVRDFARYPVAADDTDPETREIAWVACDRQGRDGRTPHHRNGLNVLFADGAVMLMDHERLGLDFDDPIIVGPDSPHPELRKMVFVPAPLSAPDDVESER